MQSLVLLLQPSPECKSVIGRDLFFSGKFLSERLNCNTTVNTYVCKFCETRRGACVCACVCPFGRGKAEGVGKVQGGIITWAH